MTQAPTPFQLVALTAEETPGLSDYVRRWLRGNVSWVPAGPPLRASALAEPRTASDARPPAGPPTGRLAAGPDSRVGPAWQDAAFAQELRERHARLAASPRTLAAIEMLAEGGAACVVAGQQPGLLGGPLYTAYKIAGAIALARRLEERGGRPVVPVYWCGADDSDFDEARGIWLLHPARGPLRVELPRGLAAAGQQIGALAAYDVEPVERGALAQLESGAHGRYLSQALQAAQAARDLGERAAAFYLTVFGGDGLVVVDARSPRLLALGRPLFARHARAAAEHAAAVDARGAQMVSAGIEAPLAPKATRSGLFRVQDGLREKLEPQRALAALEAGDTVAPAVLLRPLWQDALLAPLAAVLGPSELAYHAQIAPMYEALGVRGASPVLRPHVTLLPPGVTLPPAAAERALLLSGGDGARELLAQGAMPARWRDAADKARAGLAAVLGEYAATLGEQARTRTVAKALERVRRELAQAERAVAAAALEQAAQREGFWRWAGEWLCLRGVVQERAFAAAMGWGLWDGAFTQLLSDLASPYADAVERGAATGFAVQVART
jgi:uncharacterized protein YllA (UPF0747 family)